MNSTRESEALNEPKEKEVKRDAKPVPTSLSEFLGANKVSSRRFIQHISKRPALTEDDLARAHALIDAQPAKMGRVVELARAAAGAVPQPGTLLCWCEQVLRSRDDALHDWALDPDQVSEAAFRELLNWAYPLIRGKGDRARRQLAEACVLVGMNLLIARRALAPLHALRQLASASGTHGDRRGTSLERTATKQLMRVGVKQLVDLARVAALCDKEMTAVEDAHRAAVGLAGNLRRDKETLENERDALTAKVQGLSRDLDQKESRIVELTADLEGARVRALQDIDKLKARFRREIGERLGGLLADAWDAIDTDPPHPTVARERLEIARDAIRREIEWLNKSSD